MTRLRQTLSITLLLTVAASASAQLLPPISLPSTGPIGSVTGPVQDIVGPIDRTIGGLPVSGLPEQVSDSDVRQATDPSLSRLVTERWIQSAPPATLLDLRRLRLAQLVRQSNGALEMDSGGNPAVHGRLILLDPTAAQLAAARRLGFAIAADETDAMLDMRTVMVSTPANLSLRAARQRLAAAVPGLAIEFDHVFEPAGGALVASSAALAASTTAATGRPVVGMIDGGVSRHPALGSASIEQRGFAGPAQATGHGTAVASLIVGNNGRFRGAAPGASLLVGDVYGGNPSAGSATAIVKALSWLAAKRPSVINISLVGPRNALVERAAGAVHRRGIRLVAAVGNDGPAAPPQYPASHAGVIAVTGVDARNRALPEAGRALHLDYAAPAADMAAALPGNGYTSVRGTSFAAPLVASRLAVTGSTDRLNAEATKGRGRVGRGIICGPCRIAPKAVGAK